MDLSQLSITELRDLQSKVQQAIAEQQNQAIARARVQIMTIAEQAGLPLRKLLQFGSKPVGAPRGKVAVKYRHPDHPMLHWTGRGRQPQWISAWLAESGNTLEMLRV